MPDRLPIDVVRPDPDPDPGDPWPRHLCMPSVERHEPIGPVLRPDTCHRGHTTAAPVRHHDAPPLRCPPCHGDCRQGRDCPARCSGPASPMSAEPAAPPILKPAHLTMITAISFMAVYAVVAAAVALLFRDAFSTRAELALASIGWPLMAALAVAVLVDGIVVRAYLWRLSRRARREADR